MDRSLLPRETSSTFSYNNNFKPINFTSIIWWTLYLHLTHCSFLKHQAPLWHHSLPRATKTWWTKHLNFCSISNLFSVIKMLWMVSCNTINLQLLSSMRYKYSTYRIKSRISSCNSRFRIIKIKYFKETLSTVPTIYFNNISSKAIMNFNKTNLIISSLNLIKIKPYSTIKKKAFKADLGQLQSRIFL